MTRLRRGALISFSGVDCSGKSTQLEIISERLRNEGYAVARVWNRVGYTAWFQAAKEGVRKLRPGTLPAKGASFGRHKQLGNPRTRMVWLAAACADLVRLYNVTIGRLLLTGHIVLCDRYLADSHVDLRLHFPETDLTDTALWRSVVRLAPVPDLALFFDVPLDVAIARANIKQEIYRQPDDALTDRIDAYAEAARSYPLDNINGDRPKDVIAAEVQALVDGQLGQAIRRGEGPAGQIS